MKKSIFLAVLFCISMGAFAYLPGVSPEVKFNQEKTTKQKDCVMMKDNKMYVIKGGEATEMVKAVVMSNGTKVLANGEVILKNNETLKLQNGDCVYMNGKIEKKSPGLND